MRAAAPRTAKQRMTLADVGPRNFEVLEPGYSYRLDYPGINVTFLVDRLSWHRSELTGEMKVTTPLLGTDAIDGVLSEAAFNFTASRSRTERAGLLQKRFHDDSVPFDMLVEDFCLKVIGAERDSNRAVRLNTVELPDEEAEWIYPAGLKIPFKEATILYGDSDSCKSYLSLFLAGELARKGHRVLMCDWEMKASPHRAR